MKITKIIRSLKSLFVISVGVFLLQNCSEDDQIILEGTGKFETKSRSNVSSTETCQIIFTFSEIGLSESQKAVIKRKLRIYNSRVFSV